VLDWFIFFIYSVVSLAFLPLFVSIMTLLKVTYPDTQDKIKLKVSLVFAVFLGFLILRLYLYIDFKNLHLLFSAPSIYSTIPFYLTEIIIAISLHYVLFISGQMENSGESQHQSGASGGLEGAENVDKRYFVSDNINLLKGERDGSMPYELYSGSAVGNSFGQDQTTATLNGVGQINQSISLMYDNDDSKKNGRRVTASLGKSGGG
jgi:hypothetical protein